MHVPAFIDTHAQHYALLEKRHRLPCDKDRLARHASITRPQLTDTFQSARTLLRIELPPLTIADLAVSFGCNQLKPTAMGLLGLVGHFVMQGRVVGDGGVAACFWLVCRAVRQSISKGKLCDRVLVRGVPCAWRYLLRTM